MYQASLYSNSNNMQKTDAIYVFNNYLHLIKWKGNENILDVGTGDGAVLFDLLRPKIPKKFNKLVAMDISEEMVNFAKNKYQDRRVDFVQFDISSKKIPLEFHQHFHHIFSFYCLHWIIEQRQVMKNLFEMLQPNGDIFVTFLASNPMYDVYERMGKSKWCGYMKDLERYIPPYQHSKNQEFELEKILKEQGFLVYMCRAEDRTYTFSNHAVFANTILAVNPFIKNIPENKVNSFIEDYLNEWRKMDNITFGENEEIEVPYKLFVVFATKPM